MKKLTKLMILGFIISSLMGCAQNKKEEVLIEPEELEKVSQEEKTNAL